MDVGDDEYTIKRVNPAYEDQSDVATGTIEGKTPREIVGDEQGAEVEAHYRECIERREPVEYEEDLVFDDRETHWLTKIAPVVIDGTVEYIVGSTREITERKEREARIETLKERLELAVEGANLGIWDWDMRTDDVEFNETWATMLGYTPEELDSCFEVWEQRVHPDDLDDVKKALSRHVEEQSPHYDVEHRLRTATDDWKWIRTVGKVAERDGEEPVRAVGIHIDIDDRRRREQELKRSQRRLDQTQTVANVGGWEVDLQTEAVTWTDEMYQIHGVNHDFEPTIEKVLDFYISEDREKVRTAIEQAADGGDSFHIEARIATPGGDIRRVRTHCEPVFEDDAVVKVVGAQKDITDQYEKRARILRELHAATQELYPIRSESDVIAYLDSFLEQAFEFDHTCVMRFDDDTGSLRPQSVSSTLTDDASILGEVLPSDHPVWRAFQHDESVTSEDVAIQAEAFEDGTHNQLLAVPIGEFGVAVAINAGRTPFDQVDTELVEVAAANAKSASDSLWSARARSELNEKFSTKQDTIDSLRDMIETTQSLQQMFGNGVTKAEIETNTCDELLGLDPIDFVWIGRPRDGTTALSPTEWAGDGSEYLDSVGSENQTELPPSERAAAQREPIAVSDVPSRVKREEWAKTALSADFRSILSIPLVYDDVLYGVLTVCARETDAFGQSLETFLRIVGSFLVNRNRMLELRTGESEWLTELEVTGEWATYPVQRLAATTESRIRYETVIERDPETVRILVTVEDGDPATVYDAATDISDILAANRLGNEGQNRLTLTCQRPFLSSVVEQHGRGMADAVSTPSETTCRVHVRMSASTRPIVESLHSRYEDVDVVSQKQQPRSFVGEDTDVEDRLTDRQREILETAYHAGFFETPRDVTLGEIADNFDISKPAVYNHLQAAYRTVFESIFEADTPVR
ncbi:PAS domain S-box protein [Halorhabdus sp. CBA1104]|uniref:PAS domain-containing protein n=1 Tax=Halorhabdus sp. CBA1104 TaxID=1380432 RepID=UPI0012B383E4|nr:PAS domain-containing protein [Halorhabdus sp. CBA1104]QGN06571.1 PAS domain S-box protein [Halorhabdus sp. CBA1104]